VAAAPAYGGSTADALVAGGAHLMLKVRTSIVNGTFERGHAVTERWARRPFRARLYEKFRPDVPYGNEGWGKRAVLDVELIRAATEAPAASCDAYRGRT